MSTEDPCDEMDSAAAAAPAPTVKITDLDNLCLEKICGYLDVQSLFNVAHVNRSLQAAAIYAYGQQFGAKTIWMHDVRKPRFHVLGNKIFVDSLKLILPYLRLFGANITKLIVMFSKNDVRNERIDQYIGQYCADTLASISFHEKPAFSFNYLKPFGRIDTVHIVKSALHDNLHGLINWFPNMGHLEIDTASIYQCSAANVQFPQLEHLKVKHNSISLMQIDDLLPANPQLQSFHIYADHCGYFVFTGYLLRMIRGNALLKKFTASITEAPTTIADADEAQRFISEHPLLTELDLPRHQFNANDARRLTRELNSLKMLRIQMKKAEYQRFSIQLGNEWQREHDEGSSTSLGFSSDSYTITFTR